MLINKIYKKILGKIKFKQKTLKDWENKKYNKSPIFTFIIQTHNKSKSVCKIVDKLRKQRNSEIIVLDDGSNFKNSKKLYKKLTKANEFIIRSNDLYECITYNKAIKMSAGIYIALLQDDDDFDNLNWVKDAKDLFQKYDNMVILGGRDGIRFCKAEKDNSNEIGDYQIKDGFGQRKNLLKFEIESNSKFRFVQSVNRAPMWIRKKLFNKKLNEIDQEFAPFQWDDAELCLRANKNNLLVGLYDANFQTGELGVGGMRIHNIKLTNFLDVRNAKKLYSKYEKHFIKFDDKIKISNENIAHKHK